MPPFAVSKSALQPVAQSKFTSEKALQLLVETNLDIVFKCRLVASEFPTGAQHAGRIDTLALSEGENPVIIEYKNVESSDLINQSLFCLSWIYDIGATSRLLPKERSDRRSRWIGRPFGSSALRRTTGSTISTQFE